MDEQIRSLLRSNNPKSLELIWETYAADLLVYLVGLLRSRSDAEDELQDLFIRIAKNHQGLSEVENLRAYLYRMARNGAVNRMRSNQRRQRREEASEDWLQPKSPKIHKEDLSRVQRALSSLPASQRLVITMKFFREHSFREIGERLGISANTAGSRYRYGMRKLKALLKEIS